MVTGAVVVTAVVVVAAVVVVTAVVVVGGLVVGGTVGDACVVAVLPPQAARVTTARRAAGVRRQTRVVCIVASITCVGIRLSAG
jgi:hypothetical protein